MAAPAVSAAREREELEEYLGAGFELARLQDHERELERELAACGDERAFYRSSEAYLYDLTAFAMTGTKDPYLRRLVRLVPPPARVLDYGCGIGSDGLALLEAGYEVEFADFDNPSTTYLRWRLDHRGLAAPIWDLEVEVPGGYDAAYAFDVIEHVDDPFAFLGELERRSELVLVNLLEPGPPEREPSSHRELPIERIADHALGRGLRSYEIHHGRSHLLGYETGAAGALARLRGRAAIAAARARRGRRR